MHLNVQDELGFAEILNTVLRFEAVPDPLNLAAVRRNEEEVINVEGSVVGVSLPLRCAHRCRSPTWRTGSRVH